MSKEVITKKDRDESIELYMGEDNIKHLKSMTEKELTLFKSFKIDVTKSYLVKGSENLLWKFKAFFTAHCAYERLSYATFMLKEYASLLQNSSTDEAFLASSERELLFLYLHSGQSGVGNTEEWMCSTILDRVANRNRKGLITIILSERNIPLLEKAKSEFDVINLGGASVIKKLEEAAKSFKTAEAKKNGETGVNVAL